MRDREGEGVRGSSSALFEIKRRGCLQSRPPGTIGAAQDSFTNGFFPGQFLYLYEHTNDTQLLQRGIATTLPYAPSPPTRRVVFDHYNRECR